MTSPSIEACAFCTPEQLQERIVRIGEQIISFVSKPAYRPGQTLVIPKRHVESVGELTAEETVEIMREIGRIGSLLDLGYGREMHQKSAPQQVGNGIAMAHLHFHVVPKHADDGVFSVPATFGDFYTPSDAEIAHYVQKLQ